MKLSYKRFEILRNKLFIILISCLLSIGVQSVYAQNEKVQLIVRADDMGSSHAANRACIESAKNGIATSIELMVPCAWFDEAVTLLNENPAIDVGVHLTLTAEWPNYKWKPVTACKSIVDAQGNFFPRIWPSEKYPGQSVKETAGNLKEIEQELRAQIELAIERVPHISHLSEHMGCLRFSDEAKALAEKLAREYNLPINLGSDVKRAPKWSGNISSKEHIDNLVAMLEGLESGTYLTIEHPARDVPEIQAIEPSGNIARTRQGVTDAFTHKKVKKEVQKNKIQLVSYKDVIAQIPKTEVRMGRSEKQVKNILVILADDHALKVTGSYGNHIIRTPSIDKLATEGVMFTDAYCNSPICSASRQSLLTGKYPHATGVNLLFTPFPDGGNITIAEHLRDAGYSTALFGKTHFNNSFWHSLYKNGTPDHGFDINVSKGAYNNWLKKNPMPEIPVHIKTYSRGKDMSVAEWMNCEVLPQPVYDEFSEGTFFAQKAIEFIEESATEEKPFLCWLAFYQPHHPYYFPIEYQGKYKPEDMPLPVGSPEDDRWIPAKFKNLSDDEKRGIIASYYTSAEYLDKNIGLVIDALKAKGIYENTLIVYLSDNGYLLHEHKRFEKHTMWEESTHQPMVVRLPGNDKNGSINEALIEYVDVVPTLLDLTGNRILSEVQGKSFAPVLVSGENEFRDYVFSEYLQDNTAMVATKEYKYIFHTGSRDLGIGYATGHGPSGLTHRLYHLGNAPDEGTNLADFPESKAVLLKMQQLMLSHFMNTYPEAEKCPEGLTLEGKLVWFCEPRDIGTDQSLIDTPVVVKKKK